MKYEISVETSNGYKIGLGEMINLMNLVHSLCNNEEMDYETAKSICDQLSAYPDFNHLTFEPKKKGVKQ